MSIKDLGPKQLPMDPEIRAPIEEAVGKLKEAAELYRAKSKELGDQYDATSGQKTTNPYDAPYKKWEALRPSLHAAWTEITAQVTSGAEQPAWTQYEGNFACHLNATDKVLWALTSLLGGPNELAATHFGELAGPMTAYAYLRNADTYSKQLGAFESLVPKEALDKLMSKIEGDYRGGQQRFERMMSNEPGGVAMLQSPVLKDLGIDPSKATLSEVFARMAEVVAKDPDQQLIRNRDGAVHSWLADSLKRASDSIAEGHPIRSLNAIISVDNYGTSYTGPFAELMKALRSADKIFDNPIVV